MADIFKIITQGPRRNRERANQDNRLSNMLKNTESFEYAKKNKKVEDDTFKEFENITDASVGEEKDRNNYLIDVPKLSLRTLDQKPEKEQLKILKLEYNRIYDRLEMMNAQILNNEKLISDMRMESRQTNEMNREMRMLVRKIVETFPGNVEVKEMVSTGDWTREAVFPVVEAMVKSFINRVKQVDLVIQEESKKFIEENTVLKAKLEQYKETLSKFNELELTMAKQATIIEKYKENEAGLIDKVKAAREQTKKVLTQYENKLKEKMIPTTTSSVNNEEREKMLESIQKLKEHIVKLNKELEAKPKVEYVEKIVEKIVEVPVEKIVYKTMDSKEKTDGIAEVKAPSDNVNVEEMTKFEISEEESLITEDTSGNFDSLGLDVEDDILPLTFDDDDLIPLDINGEELITKVPEFESPLLAEEENESITEELHPLAPDVEKEQLDPKHEPHFKKYFEENGDSLKEDRERLEKAAEDKNHPLSPDYVETEEEEVGVMFDHTIDAYIQNLSLSQETLLKFIGRTGISRTADLKQRILEDEEAKEHYVTHGKANNTAINKDISEMKSRAVLSVDSVNYGGRNGGSFNVFALSDTGKLCYKKMTGKNPVISEKQRMIDLHATLEHGYLIKDSANIFREMGYKIYTELEDVTFKIDNKSRKVFDYIAEDKEGKLYYIEVERGTHTQEGFSNALNKIYEFTREFYFICPNETVRKQGVRKKFFVWVNQALGGVQNADVVLNTTTMDTLRKKPMKIWETTDLREVD